MGFTDILKKTEDDIVTLIVLRVMAETFLEIIDKCAYAVGAYV